MAVNCSVFSAQLLYSAECTCIFLCLILSDVTSINSGAA